MTFFTLSKIKKKVFLCENMILKKNTFSLQVAEEGQTDAPQDQLRGKVVKFGWMDGVFVSGI